MQIKYFEKFKKIPKRGISEEINWEMWELRDKKKCLELQGASTSPITYEIIAINYYLK